MLTFKTAKLSVLALLLGTTIITPLQPIFAQPYRPYGNTETTNNYQSNLLEIGTRIPIRYQEDQETLQVDKGKTLPLTLTVAAPIRDRNGSILIPEGSQIEGQLESVGQGVRYVARELKIRNNNPITFNATSDVVGRTEIVNIGASVGDIVKGTLSGAGAATIIAGTTGDRRIDALEVLAGAAVGTLAGWGLPQARVVGGKTKEVVTINPNRDLSLIVQSPLYLEESAQPAFDRFPDRSRTTRPTFNNRWPNGRVW